MIRLIGAVVGTILLYTFVKNQNINLASPVKNAIAGRPTTGRTGQLPNVTSATAQDLNASSNLVTSFAGLFKAFQPASGSTVLDIRSNPPHAPVQTSSYGTVTAPDPMQLPPSSWSPLSPSVFTGNPVLPNYQPTNDAGVASGTDNRFLPDPMGLVFDGTGGTGYGIGAGTYEGNAFGLDPSSMDPTYEAPLSAADLYNTDVTTL